MTKSFLAAALLALAGPAIAQTPTAEELRALIDQRVAATGPYAALLSDPDPLRQQAAVAVMMETGDAKLIAMAAAAGLRSSDADVRQATLEAYLKTSPSVSITVDGAGQGSGNFSSSMRKAGAAVSPESLAGVTYVVGPYDEEHRCYMHVTSRAEGCFLFVSKGGIQVRGARDYFTMQGTLQADGTVAGYASVANVQEGLPATIKLQP